MATGEGKTLAATLAVCSAALASAAVHVVTVNDYLAERDAEENGPLYRFIALSLYRFIALSLYRFIGFSVFRFFGLSVGVVKQDMPIDERQTLYAKRIVYVSNKELTFDYLKDQITLRGMPLTQVKLQRLQGAKMRMQPILRGLHLAIIDEADSVLIDEARTPLIISEDDLDLAIYQQAIELAEKLEEGRYFLKTKEKDIWLSEVGEQYVTGLCGDLASVWCSPLWRKELIGKA